MPRMRGDRGGVEWGSSGPNFQLRRLIVLAVVATALLIGVAIHDGVITNEAPPVNSPDIMEDPRP